MPVITGLDYITFTNKIKYAFVALLRAGFAGTYTPNDFKYVNEDASATQIAIHTAFPRRIVKYPTVVVSAESGDTSVRFLVDDLIEPIIDANTGEETGSLFGGPIALSIKVTVFALSTFEREKIIDLAALFIRIAYKYVLKDRNIEIMGIRMTGESQSEEDEKVVYENSLVIECYSEIQFPVSTEFLGELDKINAEIDVYSNKSVPDDIREFTIE